MKVSEIEKYSDILQGLKTKCKCGYRMLIPFHVDKILCSHCGKYVYRNKKTEFKDKLIKEMKKNEKDRRNQKNTKSNN